MPRGISIVPRHSSRKKYDVPEELKSSFFGNSAAAGDEPTRTAPHISVFDDEGNLTARQVGVHTFRFRRTAMFYYVRSLNWATLLSLSITIYLLIVMTVSIMYFIWGNMCGADDSVNVIGAVYFTVVSLAANGGYLGEDPDTMANPNDLCYKGRTLIVMACSYVNILFVGIVAALVVSKAESTSKLGNRIVFSTYCTLSPVPGRPDQWKLAFRVANVENMKPLVNGKLRLFCLSTQPMSEYKKEQREQRKLLHYMRRARKVAASTTDLTNISVAEKLTNDLLKRKRGFPTASTANLSANAVAASAGANPESGDLANASFSAQDPMVKTLLAYKGRQRREEAARREKRRVRKLAEKAAATRGRHKDPLPSAKATTTAVPIVESGAEHGEAESDTHASRSSSSSSARSVSLGSTASDEIKSDRTNSSVSERQEIPPSVSSPRGQHSPVNYGSTMPVQGSPTGTGAGQHRRGHNSNNNNNLTFPHISGHHHDHDDEWEDELPRDGDMWERVFITTQELSWTCAGESYLDKGSSGELGLWYPASITHHIDERSPLFRFMDVRHVGIELLQEMVLGVDVAAEVRKQQEHQRQGALRGSGPRGMAKRFQLVVVFEATEIETGATITAKHTYDTSDIIANAKFSNKLVRMHKKTREVWLDYHYFNDILPLLATDSSTTDSEA